MDDEHGTGNATATAEPAPPRGKRDWIEIGAILLLAAAALISAYSAYQASLWNGEQSAATSEAFTLRTARVQTVGSLVTLANRHFDLMTEWIREAAAGNTAALAALESLIDDDLRPAFEAWLATAPDGQVPAGLPMDLPEYDVESFEVTRTAVALEDAANAAAAEAADASQSSGNFTLVTVLMASVLFVAGFVSNSRSSRLRVALFAAGAFLFVVGSAYLATLPHLRPGFL